MNKTSLIIFSLLLFSLISINGIAQKKIMVGISMGQVIPLNEFKSVDYTSLTSGFSESGFTLNFDGDYYLHNRFAVSARFNFGITSMNKVEVSDWLDLELNGYLSENEENNFYSMDYWQWSSPMLGMKYNYPIIVNKFYIETGFFSGLSIVKVPTQNMRVLDEVNKQEIFSENIEKSSLSVPIMFDAGLRFVINDKVQLKIQSSYFQTKANYQHVNYIVKENSTIIDEELGKTSFEVPIQTINLSVGFIYKL